MGVGGGNLWWCLSKMASTHFDFWRCWSRACLRCYISSCLMVTCIWPRRNWKHSPLCIGSTGPLSKMMTKTSIHNLREFPKDRSLLLNISLPEIFHYKEQLRLLWPWCLDYSCFFLIFQSKEILVNLCLCINQLSAQIHEAEINSFKRGGGRPYQEKCVTSFSPRPWT